MKRKLKRRPYWVLILVSLVLAAGWAAWSNAQANQGWKSVEKILGYPGQEEGDGFKVVLSREDLNVLVRGAWLAPESGLSCWFAFKPLPHDCLLIGELTLVDGELAQVEAQLENQGLTLLSLYRPFIGENPGVVRLRFDGQGSRVSLAQKAKVLLTATGMPSVPATSAPINAPPVSFKTILEKVLGPGVSQGAALGFAYLPLGPIVVEGVEVPSYMGVESGFWFQPNGKQALAYGQWVVPADKAGEMIKTLFDEKIMVTNSHCSYFQASPIPVEICFWAQGEPKKLAKSMALIVKKAGLIPVPIVPAPVTGL